MLQKFDFNFLIVFILLPFCNSQDPDTQITVDDPAQIANRTYAEHLDAIHKKILQGNPPYDRERRPVKNESSPLLVFLHSVIQHFSVDEVQQIIDLQGFMYFNWKDEFLNWNPKDFNQVSNIWVHGWQIWKPKIRIQNSAQGRMNSYSIGWYTKAQITSKEFNDYAMVTVFPKFNIRITCVFDYSDYPNDVQKCPLVLYGREGSLRKLEFQTLHTPGVALTWDWFTGDKKQHISNWYVDEMTQNVAYWGDKGIKTKKPLEKDRRSTWSVYQIWITLRRHEPYFGVMVRMPAIFSSLITLSSFYLNKPEHRIYVLLGNVLIQGIFTRELLARLPPSIGNLPRIVKFYGFNLVLTFFALVFLLLMHKLSSLNRPLPLVFIQLFKLKPFLPCFNKQTEKITFNNEENLVEVENQPNPEDEKPNYNQAWLDFVQILIIVCSLCFALFYFIIMCMFLS